MVPESFPLDGRLIEVGASKRILEYWDRGRGTNFAPAFGSEFKLSDLSEDILECASVVDVIDGGKTYKYDFWGTGNVEVKGFDMTGLRLDEAPVPEVSIVGHYQFSEVMKRRYPVAFAYRAPYRVISHREQITFRFPLSSNGATIDKIFSWQNLKDESGSWVEFFGDFWSSRSRS